MWPRRRPVPRVYSDTAHVRDPGLSLVLDDPGDDPCEEVWQLAEKRAGDLAAARRECARLRSKLAEAEDIVKAAEFWATAMADGPAWDIAEAEVFLIAAVDAHTSRLADGGTTT